MAALEFVDITKRFGGTLANDHVSIAFAGGEIHAVLGENGAGKTTLMRIASGLEQPDAGEVRIRGEAQTIDDPARALELGVGMVHQHFTLVPNLTVAENVILGLRGPEARLAAAAERIRDLSRSYGIPVDPTAMVESLSAGERQRVEIAKLLYRQADVLILDEPTALLSPAEADRLFSAFADLARDGRAIVFITHKLREVFAIADRISVLRAGRLRATVETSATTPAELSRLMVGEDADVTLGDNLAVTARTTEHAAAEAEATDARSDTPVRVAVRDASVTDRFGRQRLRSCSFEVRAGEVFGIAGVEGNGQNGLAQALVGLMPLASGDIEILGTSVRRLRHRDVSDLGVAFVPEDRQTEGLVMPFSARENLLLRAKHRTGLVRWGLIRSSASRDVAERLAREFDVLTSSVDAPVSALSGGNQQKLVLARELVGDPAVIVASQATRGLDLKATAYVHDELLRRAAEGAAVVFISSDLDEVLSISTRIGVLYRGELVADVAHRDADRATIGALMAGAEDAA